jgi:CubicO group peptidase (beta-lactamase class C family)
MRDVLAPFLARYRVPAIGAAVVDVDGTCDARVAGVRRRGHPDPIELTDAWHIGSCAKAITAALYARLVEQGRAAWGLPVAELFAHLGWHLHEGWSRATIDELFTCRSGMRANPTRAEVVAAYADQRPDDEQRRTASATALAEAPRRHGSFRYSNLGYVVAGAGMELATGRSFEELLRAELLEPLGVTTAGFGPPPRAWGHHARRRFGNICVGVGDPLDPADRHSDNPPLLTPAGRLHLDLADWMRVQRLFLDGAGILSKASVDHLLRPPPDDRGISMGWAPARGLAGAALGMQGSNTAWVATALMSTDRRRVAMAITNDGRTRMMRATAMLAAELLG